MINRHITTAEAADRLGVKPATLYSYVSRGLLTREKTAAGSTFDLLEVARLARTARHPGSGHEPRRREAHPPAATPSEEPIFVTELTLIEGGRLYYRGIDAVDLARERGFEEIAEWLWTGVWPDPSDVWTHPARIGDAVASALRQVGPDCSPTERLSVAVMAVSLADELRHDLNPAGVPVTARALLSALVEALPMADPNQADPLPPSRPMTIPERFWSRLSPLPATSDRIGVLEAALVLAADHELAPSTLAARVAASFRADPYAVVLTGIGPASGDWPSGSTGAPSEVERLMGEALGQGAEAAIGARLRRDGAVPHGFGMPLYPGGDPRGAELLSRTGDVSWSPERVEVVERIVAIGRAREFPQPNMDLGLGALSFCAEMIPGAGQAISTFGKMAGWLAHAMEEYAQPTRFRIRADYVGPQPALNRAG